MIKGLTSDQLVQKLLDQTKSWKSDRFGTDYFISQFEFLKDATPQEYTLAFRAALNSSLFDSGKTNNDPSKNSISLNKNGIICAEKFDFNYEKYKKSLKPRITWFQWVTLLVAIVALIVPFFDNDPPTENFVKLEKKVDSLQQQLKQIQSNKDCCHSCQKRKQ